MKPSSVLISENGLLKLDAIDVSVQLEDDGSKRQRVVDSSLLIAPEVVANTPCLKSDVWSLGMSVLKMTEGWDPFATNTKEMDWKNRSKWSYELTDFISRCLLMDVNARASVRDLLNVSVAEMNGD